MRVRDRRRLAELLGANPAAGDLAELLGGLRETGALLEGHFALQSDLHSSYFLRLRDFNVRPHLARQASERLLAQHRRTPSNVLCPESAGYLLGRSYFEALGGQQMGSSLAVAAVNFERRPLPLLRRGQLREDLPCVVVNDVATTGQSLEALIELAVSAGTSVTGIAHFAVKDPTRVREQAPKGVNVAWLFSQNWPCFPPGSADCAGCANGVPVVPAIELN